MSTYVLIHGAGTDSWYWGPLAEELRARGHTVVAPDLPVSDPAAGLSAYADVVLRAAAEHGAAGERDPRPIIVAHSFGGFVGPLVCEPLDAALLVLLHAQIPASGETPEEWWAGSGYLAMRAAYDARPGVPDAEDPRAFSLHDTPSALVNELLANHQREQSGGPFGDPWPLPVWPSVPTRVLIASGDHFFPAPFLGALSRERLGIDPDIMPGDHSPMLGHPTEVADRLEAYARVVESR